MILTAEESLAREVAPGVIVKKPLNAWLCLIPGMFIFDYLRRAKDIRRYSQKFMFTRKLALEAAQDLANGENRENLLSKAEKSIIERLHSSCIYSHEILQLHMEAVKLLVEHYEKLFNAGGDTYITLVSNAYKDREQYEAHLHRMTAAEENINNSITKKLDDPGLLTGSLHVEQRQLEKMREMHTDEIFCQ